MVLIPWSRSDGIEPVQPLGHSVLWPDATW
jgi:hypothetical protein